MSLIAFTVREICQSASGGSYVVGYTAEVQLTDSPSDIDIEVLSTVPPDADQEFIDYAIQSTRKGFAEILEPMQRGATVRLKDLLLHSVDFNPIKQRKFSSIHLKDALSSSR